MKSDELLGWHLLSIHNLTFYHTLMAAMRASILQGTFLPFYERMRVELALEDIHHPVVRPKPAKPFHFPRIGDYEIHPSKEGFNSVRQISSGEVMHSVNNPDEEAEPPLRPAIRARHPSGRSQAGRQRAGSLGCRPRRRHQCDGRAALL